MKVIHYSDSAWKAVLAPLGGNLIRLQWCAGELDILRHPHAYRLLEEKPEVWGLPPLFLPNRIEDGTFTLNGIHYSLPRNNRKEHNHIHGWLHHAYWRLSLKDNSLKAEYEHRHTETWPHDFHAEVHYHFSPAAVHQGVSFRNTGETPMPFLFGQHSAFRLPWKDSTVQVTLAPRQIVLNARNLPTGTYAPVETNCFDNSSGPVSLHAENLPDLNQFSGAIIRHPEKNIEIVYSVDPRYRFWMLWNWQGKRKMFCAEPQTCTVNAVKAAKLLGDTGVKLLSPGEEIKLESAITVRVLDRSRRI